MDLSHERLTSDYGDGQPRNTFSPTALVARTPAACIARCTAAPLTSPPGPLRKSGRSRRPGGTTAIRDCAAFAPPAPLLASMSEPICGAAAVGPAIAPPLPVSTPGRQGRYSQDRSYLQPEANADHRQVGSQWPGTTPVGGHADLLRSTISLPRGRSVGTSFAP
jgi:hypothetical protein